MRRNCSPTHSQRKPVRVIHDPYLPTVLLRWILPINEVRPTDENLLDLQLYIYTTTTTLAPNGITEPIRKVGGLKTNIEFQCGLYVDPKNGDIYAVNNDTKDHLTIFSPEARGNVAPDRQIRTPHGTFGIAVDEEHQEILLSVQHDNAVVTYKKSAANEDAPIRLLQGDNTLLADPHGMVLDTKNDLLFVANHGSVHDVRPQGESHNFGTRVHGQVTKENWPLSRDDAVLGSGKTSTFHHGLRTGGEGKRGPCSDHLRSQDSNELAVWACVRPADK